MILKKHLLLIISILFLLNNINSQGINFIEDDWQKALELSKKNKRKIFVDAYATWCGPCKRMASYTFLDSAVSKYYNENFICLKMNMQSPQGIEFNKLYPVEAFPTLFFLNEKGEVLKKAMGFKDINDFLFLGKEIIDPENSRYNIAKKKFEKGERDKLFLYEYATLANEQEISIRDIAKEYFKELPPNTIDSLKSFTMFIYGINDIKSPYSQYFAENFPMFQSKYGKYAISKIEDFIEVNVQIATEKKDINYLNELKQYLSVIIKNPDEVNNYMKQIEQEFLKRTNKS